MTILPTIPYTTTNRIMKNTPPGDLMPNLLKGLGKTETDDEPLTYLTIAELAEKKILTLNDVLWCMKAETKYNDIWGRCALKFAKEVSHLINLEKSLKALDVAEAYINGTATKEELEAAKKEAYAAVNYGAAAANAAYYAASASWDWDNVAWDCDMIVESITKAIYYATYYNTKTTEDDEAENATNAANAACAAVITRLLKTFKEVVS
jgi:hypothetical protein